jgi:hypothetical protein
MLLFLAYFPYFEKKKKRIGLRDHLAVCVSVYMCIRPEVLNGGTNLCETLCVCHDT